MPRVRLELHGSLGRAFDPAPTGDALGLEAQVAPGETLGRLLERLVWEQPALERIYDPESRRVAEAVKLTVNGRAYHLVGGLTYLLNDDDVVAAFPVEVEEDGSDWSQ